MILIKNRQKKYPLDTHYIKETVQNFLIHLDTAILILVSGLPIIQALLNIIVYIGTNPPNRYFIIPLSSNHKGRQKDKSKNSDQRNLGDIIISLEFVRTSKRWRDCEPQDTLKILLVHGICHLLGYDHETDEDYQKMHAKEQRLLKILDNKN
jgi:rRNA maturation RNase YbeY